MSMGRMVHGTNGLHVVRIVNGTNSPDPSYNMGITLLSAYIFPRVVAITLVRMRQNSINSASGLKTSVTIDFSGYDFL